MQLIDLTRNPRGSRFLPDRLRYLARRETEVRAQVLKLLRDSDIKDIVDKTSHTISLPQEQNTDEPSFHKVFTSGKRHVVHPGNPPWSKIAAFSVGDKHPRPVNPRAPGAGGGNGDDVDSFTFTLTNEEFLRIVFHDIDLPNLLKKLQEDIDQFSLHRRGLKKEGSPSGRDLHRTMQRSQARRIGLKRPKPQDLENAQECANSFADDDETPEALRARGEVLRIRSRMKAIPFIDESDEVYRRFERVPDPVINAAMFCLMDVSGSMTKEMKDRAKRFFLLLHTFLKLKYKRVEIIYIRHTDDAEEVPEQKFFRDPKTGGTTVSPALSLKQKIQRARFPVDKWNIYGAQAGDGDNREGDDVKCKALMNEILPVCQHFAYIELALPEMPPEFWSMFNTSPPEQPKDSDLWELYSEVRKTHPNLDMRKIEEDADLRTIFFDLYKQRGPSAPTKLPTTSSLATLTA